MLDDKNSLVILNSSLKTSAHKSMCIAIVSLFDICI